MGALAATSNALFSVVTTGDAPPPSLRALIGLPPRGETHLDYTVDTPSQRNIWAARLDEAVLRANKPVLLVANGASCHAAAWWARLSPRDYIARIAGALLFDPAQIDDPDTAERFASPKIVLPFPSVVVSGNRADEIAHIQDLASNWGSGVARFPLSRGSLRKSARWMAAQEALLRVTGAIVERRMRVAGGLGVSLDEED